MFTFEKRCSNAPITQFFKYQQKKGVFTNRKEVAVKFSIRKQGPATPADKDKINSVIADRSSAVSTANPTACNSSNQARTAIIGSPQTPTSFAATFISSPPPLGTVKTVAKGRMTPARVSMASGQNRNCSPVAVRVASPAGTTLCVANSGGNTNTPAVVSVSGVSAGVSVITTGGTLSSNDTGGGSNVLGVIGAAGGGGAVQVVGCQQLQVEKGTSSWTTVGGGTTFASGVGVKPEAKVEGGRNTLSLQVISSTMRCLSLRSISSFLYSMFRSDSGII